MTESTDGYGFFRVVSFIILIVLAADLFAVDLAGRYAVNGDAVFGDLAHKMNNVVAVYIPDGVNGDAVRGELLNDFGM